jgi:transcriptional regulator
MYIPKHFLPASEAEAETIIANNSFGILLTNGDTYPVGTHIPMDFVKNGNSDRYLYGHLSAANPQAHDFDGRHVLAIFQGSHSYVSSSWYDHVNVPTWNYVAVHVYGLIRVLKDDELRAMMKTQLDKYEQHSEHPVSFETMPGDYLDAHLKGIVAFELQIKRIECSVKLSQNRNENDYKNIIRKLEESDDPISRNVAQLMKSRKK